MKSKYDIIIIGAGPAGLACSKICAENGARVAVFERKQEIGAKVCAGGITWNGLLQRFGDISQRSFNDQRIVTRLQKASLHAKSPIIATVNRKELGLFMARQARQAGAEIYPNCQLAEITKKEVVISNNSLKEIKTVGYSILVGADGSNSIVRRHLGLPVVYRGTGINCQIKRIRKEMEWHLDPARFASGYAWIFPHRTTTSVGAYAEITMRTPLQLKKQLGKWAAQNGIALPKESFEAGIVNFDYRGVEFAKDKQKIFLAGDAAGLASGLTGEGIYPAIVSGEYIGKKILEPSWQSSEFNRLEKRHARHKKAVLYARNHPGILNFASELCCLMLRTRLLPFSAAEMAG